MDQILAFFNEVFLGKEPATSIVGLAEFKEKKQLKNPYKKVNKQVQQLKLSDLMRKASS